MRANTYGPLFIIHLARITLFVVHGVGAIVEGDFNVSNRRCSLPPEVALSVPQRAAEIGFSCPVGSEAP